MIDGLEVIEHKEVAEVQQQKVIGRQKGTSAAQTGDAEK